MDKKVIVDRIEELMKEKGISNYELKENSDVSTTIYQWKKNATRDKTRVPSLRSIEKICNYFGVTLSYFFAFNHDIRNELETQELVQAISNLSVEQRKILKSLIKELK